MQQCMATYSTGPSGRTVNVSFCVRPADHEGDHRGVGRQWTQGGERVSPPTISLAAAQRERR